MFLLHEALREGDRLERRSDERKTSGSSRRNERKREKANEKSLFPGFIWQETVHLSNRLNRPRMQCATDAVAAQRGRLPGHIIEYEAEHRGMNSRFARHWGIIIEFNVRKIREEHRSNALSCILSRA
jgi:hypothetical protein